MSDLIAETLADPAIAGFGMAVGLGLTALWLAAAWWAHADATRRTNHSLAGYIAAGWILLSTPVLLPLSLAVYAFARPSVAAGDQRVKNLIAELGATATDPHCSRCGAEVDLDWRRCPSCASWLSTPCATCGRWSDDSLELCPWCGGESRARPSISDPAGSVVPGRPSPRVAAFEATPLTSRTGAGLSPLDPAELTGSEGFAARRPRLAWRAGSPSVPRSQRSDNRRLGPLPDGRRFSRSRLLRA
jgi:RNA polymerase subunit RPABC4/transcription elongation factor Spt4